MYRKRIRFLAGTTNLGHSGTARHDELAQYFGVRLAAWVPGGAIRLFGKGFGISRVTVAMVHGVHLSDS